MYWDYRPLPLPLSRRHLRRIAQLLFQELGLLRMCSDFIWRLETCMVGLLRRESVEVGKVRRVEDTEARAQFGLACLRAQRSWVWVSRMYGRLSLKDCSRNAAHAGCCARTQSELVVLRCPGWLCGSHPRVASIAMYQEKLH